MNTIKFVIAVSIVLLSTDLIYQQVVNGQTQTQTDTNATRLSIADNKFSFAYTSDWDVIERQNRFTTVSATLVNKNINDNSSLISFESHRKVGATVPNYDKTNYNRTGDELQLITSIL